MVCQKHYAHAPKGLLLAAKAKRANNAAILRHGGGRTALVYVEAPRFIARVTNSEHARQPTSGASEIVLVVWHSMDSVLNNEKLKKTRLLLQERGKWPRHSN